MLIRLLAVICICLLCGCGSPASSADGTTLPAGGAKATLTVFAAASLGEVFQALGTQFETAHPQSAIEFNFNASPQLRGQLEQGARADVFATASTKEMQQAVASSLVVSDTQRVFARNRLIVIHPKDNPGGIQSLADLAKPGLKLVIADAPIPAGQYTLSMLEKMSGDPTYGSDFAERVLANVVSREATIEAVANKVELGEADAAVVYSTNLTPAAAEHVMMLAVPDAYNEIASYPIAVVANAQEPALAQQWLDFVTSAEGQQVLTDYGFLPAQMAQP